jgi:hypothetical protein
MPSKFIFLKVMPRDNIDELLQKKFKTFGAHNNSNQIQIVAYF